MIPHRDDGLSVLTKENHAGFNNVGTKSRIKCYSPASKRNESSHVHIPLEILLDHIASFLDRRTYNSCLLLCHKARRILQASWWKNQNQQCPPWPRKLVSRDSCCSVRCLEFSHDNLLVACGCSDGKVRSWDVRLGELPLPPSNQSHWPDEAVIALAFSNSNKNRLLASSSTDGTIRIWKIPIQICDNVTTTTNVKKQRIPLKAPYSILCFASNHHAVSLHFSPDDTYLVSGHLAARNAQNLQSASTMIEIRNARTGFLLHRLEGGGIPLGFVPSPTSLSSLGRNNNYLPEEHRLLATCGPNTSLKLWGWKCRQFQENGENDNETIVDGGRCIQQWFLDRFNTVSSVPTATTNRNKETGNIQPTNGSCEMLVATMNEPSKDSFSVWNTSSPHKRKIFQNTSPYEIQFSPDGTKIASVDDFNTVKVWRISDGFLLKTFSGGAEDDARYHDSIRFGGEENYLDESSVSYTDSDFDDALFPIHELVFSKDSSTVAVISRYFNEVHLFST